MKVLISGATMGSNFGDYLFAETFQNAIADKIGKENVYFFKGYKGRFGVSSFYAKHLKNDKTDYKIKDIDALVYMSGGYFCGNDKTLKDYLVRYLCYFRVGLKCIKKKKPIAVIGLEVAHSKSKFIERVQKKILRYADIVIVRNEESYKVSQEYGVKNLHLTTDSVFAMDEGLWRNCDISDEIEKNKDKKLFLHINPIPANNLVIKEKIVPIINEFLSKHSEYAVVLGCDQDNPLQKEALEDVKNAIEGDKVIKNVYDYPVALCKVIDECDLVVTTKLHVGIVGSKLSKSVVSFSGHTQKIKRLYAQLNEEGRTYPLADLTKQKGVDMLEAYHDKPIGDISSITALAKKNFEFLDQFIEKVKAGIK